MAQDSYEIDLIPTSEGDLTITFLGHGSLLFTYNNKTFYIDPYSKVADYAKLPKADVILLTHEHRDHLDRQAIEAVKTDDTMVVMSPSCANQISGEYVLRNGDTAMVLGNRVEAVAAYNMVHKRENGQPFHPKGAGNGYILTFGDVRVYVAGDTENIPEMEGLEKIEVAFLPMNLPYTMTPQMVAEAARTFRPRILYPYHFGATDTAKLTHLLAGEQDIEVRIRKMA
ncbi:MAG: MBL fold metallo-hydrolase [Anaerolineales bacterium]|nr:MBL fold metallo-hydrolase [Anaerolineales bacterium]